MAKVIKNNSKIGDTLCSKMGIYPPPVCVYIWIREECQRQQFEVIRRVKPKVLFLISDGGRTQEEWNKIRANRSLYDTRVDWECQCYRLYEKKNNGLYATQKKTQQFVWSKVDRCIFLEDDVIPSLSFFPYCAELLERYKDDQRIGLICGMNHLCEYGPQNSDYFFSQGGGIWGYATWKRVFWKQWDDRKYEDDSYTMKLLKDNTSRGFYRQIQSYLKHGVIDGHFPGPEFFIRISVYAHNQLQIIPTKNLIRNIGCTDDAAHTNSLRSMPKAIRKLYNMPLYEQNFPLRHNNYVIPDKKFKKEINRILGANMPLVSLYRAFETAFLRIRYGGFKATWKRWWRRTFYSHIHFEK